MNKLICDLPEKNYFAIDAASNSTLNQMIRSPAHCFEWLQSPHTPTKSMKMGSAIHTYTLEGYQEFKARYAVIPNGIDKRTKTGKAIVEELNATGKILIDHDQYTTVTQVFESVVKNKVARNLIADGTIEASMLWHDEAVGYDCKGRIDCIALNDVLVDLKTTDDASPAGFARSIAKYGYHRQAAFYSDGYHAVTGKRPLRFIFITVETKPPYCTGIYQLNDTSIQIARAEYRILLKMYKQCVEDFYWPGYDADLVMLELPGWYTMYGAD